MLNMKVIHDKIIKKYDFNVFLDYFIKNTDKQTLKESFEEKIEFDKNGNVIFTYWVKEEMKDLLIDKINKYYKMEEI